MALDRLTHSRIYLFLSITKRIADFCGRPGPGCLPLRKEPEDDGTPPRPAMPWFCGVRK
jgi:hypothetical protein